MIVNLELDQHSTSTVSTDQSIMILLWSTHRWQPILSRVLADFATCSWFTRWRRCFLNHIYGTEMPHSTTSRRKQSTRIKTKDPSELCWCRLNCFWAQIHCLSTYNTNMSLSNKLAITDVDLKDKRVLIRVSQYQCQSIIPNMSRLISMYLSTPTRRSPILNESKVPSQR